MKIIKSYDKFNETNYFDQVWTKKFGNTPKTSTPTNTPTLKSNLWKRVFGDDEVKLNIEEKDTIKKLNTFIKIDWKENYKWHLENKSPLTHSANGNISGYNTKDNINIKFKSGLRINVEGIEYRFPDNEDIKKEFFKLEKTVDEIERKYKRLSGGARKRLKDMRKKVKTPHLKRLKNILK